MTENKYCSDSIFKAQLLRPSYSVIVNRNPTTSNIVEGHKIPLSKFLKNKKATQAAQVNLLVMFFLFYSKVFFQREKEKAECHVEAIQVILYH